MTRGCFITLEGADGVGKTTQLPLLARALRERGREVVVLHEPGGTQLGERVRGILLDRTLEDPAPLAELLLFEAARAQLVAEVIRPALAAGRVVLCDRFADSTTVYQGMGRDVGADVARSLNAVAVGGCVPDRTVLLTAPLQLAARRMEARGAGDRMEQAGAAFQQRVHDGFLQLAESEPQRFRVVSAEGGVEDVHGRVLAALEGLAGI